MAAVIRLVKGGAAVPIMINHTEMACKQEAVAWDFV
jgi:hypothetical protein